MLRRISRIGSFLWIPITALFLCLGAGSAQADWQADWQKTITAAKKEGQVAVYGGYNPRYRKLNQAFEKKFGIKVNYTPGGGSAHATRILSEQRAKKYLVDVVMGGAATNFTRSYRHIPLVGGEASFL
jgi:iron(III) transport system substrate-binding protein